MHQMQYFAVEHPREHVTLTSVVNKGISNTALIYWRRACLVA